MTDLNANKEKFFHIINYGCQMNESDSEHYAGQLESMGYKYLDTYKDADLVFLNTCCIRESAEKKIHGKIGELKHLKTRKPESVIVIAGCMAQKDGDILLKKYRQIDLVLGTFYVNRFCEIIDTFLQDRQRKVLVGEDVYEDEFEGSILRKSSFSAWIPIMYGCNNFCTYCIVPYVRGRERSRPVEEILKEVRAAIGQGYKEITLLGQNVNSYGKDLGKEKLFSQLLLAADEIEGIERIRFMTSHPRDMGIDVIEAVAKGKHICEHFHLPVQAGSSNIIKAMNRGYTKEEYLNLIKKVREILPRASITTDIIVGFPGESEEDFADTLDVVRQGKYDAAYTFMYSPRSGTPAAKMSGQVPPTVKKERLKRLMDVQNQNALGINCGLVGSVQEVMVEGESETNIDNLSGRTRTNKIVIFAKPDRQVSAGDLVNVTIESAQTWILKGQAVK